MDNYSLPAASLPSERSFGLLCASVFAGLGIYGFSRGWHHTLLGVCMLVSVASILTAILAPRFLAPFNYAWFKFGQLLDRIMHPIVLAIIFYGVLTPVALVTRFWGRDELRLGKMSAESYWIERVPPGPSPETFRNQF